MCNTNMAGLNIPFNPGGPNLLPSLKRKPVKIPTLPTPGNPHGVPGGVPPLDLTRPTGPVSPGPTLPKPQTKPGKPSPFQLWRDPYEGTPDAGRYPGLFGGFKTKDFLTI